jgi:hypothetical protein
MEYEVVYKSFALTLSNELLSEDVDLYVVKLYTFFVGKETDSKSYIVIEDSACGWIEDFCSIVREDGTRTIVDQYV